jgi:hypothetical protein
MSESRENTGLIFSVQHLRQKPDSTSARAPAPEEILPGDGKIFTVGPFHLTCVCESCRILSGHAFRSS